MLEVRHMHEMDRVCQFVMGLPTWAKRKLEESWPASLSEAITKVENFWNVGRSDKSGFKKDNKFLHKKLRHEGEWNRGQSSPTKDKPKQFQGLGFKPKGSFVKKGFLSKGTKLKGILETSPRVNVSITTRWGITPKIVPSLRRGLGAVRYLLSTPI
jgi:hypothetical protein